MRVFSDNRVMEDSWRQLLEPLPAGSLPEGDLIVPFRYWQEHRQELLQRKGRLGVCVYGDDDTAQVAKDLEHFALVALDFPVFKDGRAYSHARILREHHGFAGDIRAVGDVLRDQLFFMQRCGISSFQRDILFHVI